MKSYREFWLVWCEHGGTPTVKHDTEGSATAEAERLAKRCPSSRFWVLKTIAVCEATTVRWDHTHPVDCACSSCLPF